MVLGTDPGRVPLDSKKEIYNKPHRRQGNYIPSHFPISSLHHEKFISPTIRLKFTTEGRPGKGGSCVAANHHAIPWRGDSSTKSLPMGCSHTGMMLLYTWLGRLPCGRVRTLWGQCPGAGPGAQGYTVLVYLNSQQHSLGIHTFGINQLLMLADP